MCLASSSSSGFPGFSESLLEFTFSGPSLLQSEVMSGSSSSYRSSWSGSVKEESVSEVDHANRKVGSYAEIRCLHCGEWPMPVDGRRCKQYGTILHDVVLTYNYALNVTCFGCAGCVGWEESLNKLQFIWMAAIRLVVE